MRFIPSFGLSLCLCLCWVWLGAVKGLRRGWGTTGGGAATTGRRRSVDERFAAMGKVLEVGEEDPRRAEVMSILSSIIEPDIGSDIVTAGLVSKVFISDSRDLQVTLVVGNVNSLMSKEVKNMCLIQLTALDWLGENLQVNLVARPSATPAPQSSPPPPPPPLPNGLAGVKRVIAVSSCKGGVGKSTVSVNLAYTLASMGHRVGVLDADIYGPSLPTMTAPPSTQIMMKGSQMLPLQYLNVSLMSMGFINKGASIMRGPMVNQILTQFISLTAWGELDYLVIDMPPGTGDIQLTLAQLVNISAAVIVTTPQRLSFVDVVKGVDMFDTVNVPCVAVVENMAAYSEYAFDAAFYAGLAEAAAAAPPTQLEALLRQRIEGRKQPARLFGRGHAGRLRDMWGIDSLFSLPLFSPLSSSGDAGVPYVVSSQWSGEIGETFLALARAVEAEVDQLEQAGAGGGPRADYDAAQGLVSFRSGAASPAGLLRPLDLRADCRCAVCREEMTGALLLDPGALPADVKPLGMAPIGRYAISVDWSDGHKSLYPFRQLAALVQQQQLV